MLPPCACDELQWWLWQGYFGPGSFSYQLDVSANVGEA